MYNTIYEWMNESNSEAIYEPAKAYICQFCKKRRTAESIDCYDLSKSGKMIPTQNYEDYLQSVMVELLKECQSRATAYEKLTEEQKNGIEGKQIISFQNALFTATKNGLYNQWSLTHHSKYQLVTDPETGEQRKVRISAEAEEDIQSYAEILKDDYANTEGKALEAVETDYIFEGMTDKERKYAELYGSGFTFEEIAEATGCKKSAPRTALKRYGEKVQKRLEQEGMQKVLTRHEAEEQRAKEQIIQSHKKPVRLATKEQRAYAEILEKQDRKIRAKRAFKYWKAVTA